MSPDMAIGQGRVLPRLAVGRGRTTQGKLGVARVEERSQRRLFLEDFETGLGSWSTILGAFARSSTLAHGGTWSGRATLSGGGIAAITHAVTPRAGRTPVVDFWINGTCLVGIAPNLSSSSSNGVWSHKVADLDPTGVTLGLLLFGGAGALVYIDDFQVYDVEGFPDGQRAVGDNLHIVEGYSEEYTDEYFRAYGGLTSEHGQGKLITPKGAQRGRRVIRG